MILTRLRKTLGNLGVHEGLLQVTKLFVPEADSRVVQTRMHDSKVLVLANEDVGRRMLVFRRYEERDVRALLRLIRPGDVCFDVGANTGFFSMLMARAAKEGEVHAFEPLPLNWHLLSAGALLNGYANIVANPFALGPSDGPSEFSESADGAYSSLRPVGRKPERARRTVEMRSIDRYLADRSLHRIDVMKIDVEGAEELVLEGASELLRVPSARPRAMMIELTDENLRTYGTSVRAMVDRLESAGYSALIATTDEGSLVPYTAGSSERHENIFFLAERPDEN